jgi:hypothetical protein
MDRYVIEAKQQDFTNEGLNLRDALSLIQKVLVLQLLKAFKDEVPR